MSAQGLIWGGSRPNPPFDGFPFLEIKVEGGFHHLALLPEDWALDELLDLARVQEAANRLPTCLVVGPAECYYVQNGETEQEDRLPAPGIAIADRLQLAREVEVSQWRHWHLESYVDRYSPKSGYVVGDATHGGRLASLEELERLSRIGPEGIPIGLDRCPDCGDWRGEVIYNASGLGSYVVQVFCVCQNDSRCARCGEPLAARKLCADEWDEARGAALYTPGFCGLGHRCADLPVCAS